MKKVMDKERSIEMYGSSFVTSSGTQGTPMFSRLGKQTIAEALCF